MPISGPPPGIPQVPIGAHKIWRAQIARARATKAANVPIVATPSGILRALMLSGLAASALRTFQVVVGDIETDMDDLVETIQQWLNAQGNVGFSRGSGGPQRGPRTLAIPIPLKPLRRGQSTDTIQEPSPGERQDKDRDRDYPEGAEGYWPWLERRFGNPPRNQNLRRNISHGISSF